MGQANTIIKGKISNMSQVDVIELHVNQQYLNGKIDSYASNILEDGSFMFGIELNEHQVVLLDYSRNKAPLYLEPGDELTVNFDASSFQYSFKFQGSSAGNNELFYNYLKEFPMETNRFKMLQYRRGTFWYDVEPKMDRLMQTNQPAAFTGKLDIRREQMYSLLDFSMKNNPEKITPGFRAYMEAEAFYQNVYYKMLYGHIYKNKYKLDDTFFTFLEDVPVQNERVGNPWYRQFILAYCNHKSENFENKKETYVEQYNFAKDYLQGSVQGFVQSSILVDALNAKIYNEISNCYRDFVLSNENYHYNQKVSEQYDKTVKYMQGSQAPNFMLTNNKGEMAQLSDFRGKVIYLNFWASWCAPCMKKMDQMKSIRNKAMDKNVVFLNVSLDREESKWKKALAEKNFIGEHVWADGNIDSKVAKDYEIRILPQYYIIDKNGNFAEKPTSFDLIEIQNKLIQLSTL